MRNLYLFISLLFISLCVKAQEKKVEIVQDLLFETEDKPTTDIAIYLVCNAQSVVIKSVPSDYFLPFKLYDFLAIEEKWSDRQSVYNTIQANVPSLIISPNNSLDQPPNILVRASKTMVIVDGIRYDAAILNTLNPLDIESIIVAPSTAAANYLRNN